jgi:hypothetical protein
MRERPNFGRSYGRFISVDDCVTFRKFLISIGVTKVKEYIREPRQLPLFI